MVFKVLINSAIQLPTVLCIIYHSLLTFGQQLIVINAYFSCIAEFWTGNLF